jgi:hypothetical protein
MSELPTCSILFNPTSTTGELHDFGQGGILASLAHIKNINAVNACLDNAMVVKRNWHVDRQAFSWPKKVVSMSALCTCIIDPYCRKLVLAP